jgi:hypothetical protein
MPLYIIVVTILNWILDPSHIIVCPIDVIILPLDSIRTVRNIVAIFVNRLWTSLIIARRYLRKRWSSCWHLWRNHLLYFLSCCIYYFSLLYSFNSRSYYFSFRYCWLCLIFLSFLRWLYRARLRKIFQDLLLVDRGLLHLIFVWKSRRKLLLLYYFIFIDLFRFNWNGSFFF